MAQPRNLGNFAEYVSINSSANTITFSNNLIVANDSYINVASSLLANSSRLILGASIAVQANGGLGSSGQALTTNGAGVYWSTIVGTNTDAQYTWTNTQIFANTITFNQTINGTANNTSFVGSVSAANVVSNAQLSANLGNYQTAAGLNANIAAYLPNYTGVVNGSSFTVSSSYIANSTGVYHTGVINATSISTGSINVINSTGLTTTANVNIGSSGKLIITAGAGIYANGGLGSSGQLLYSNGSSVYWANAGGGGATLVSNTTDTQTFYIPMANTTSGTWTNAVVSDTKLYYVPSTGTLSSTVFVSLSDARFKTDIEEINGQILLNEIHPVKFSWKDSGIKSYGVIAQELESILPELVETNDKGYKSVSYIPMIAMLIDVVKKQQIEIENIKKQLKNVSK